MQVRIVYKDLDPGVIHSNLQETKSKEHKVIVDYHIW